MIDLSHENRMQPQNVAIVFGPTLLWHSDDPTRYSYYVPLHLLFFNLDQHNTELE